MIERSKDAARIKTLVGHPSVFPHVTDDFYRDPEKWEPSTSDLVMNLIASDARGDFGFGIFLPRTWSCYEAHMGFLPRSYGPQAIAAFSEMLDWVWSHSKAVRIVGEICQENRKAIKFAMNAGFQPYGVNQKSRLRGGVYRDQVCLGISRP